MKIHLRLMGTLPSYYPGAYPEAGLEISVTSEISVAELVALVNMPQEHVAIVAVNGTIAKADDTIPLGAEVKFFQALNGG